MNLLCWLGLHEWKIKATDNRYIALAHLCGLDHTLHECNRCGKSVDLRDQGAQ